jgi:hypothetical protein
MGNYRETVYRGRDNEIRLALEQDGRVIDAAGVTRVQLVFKQPGAADATVDSSIEPAMFEFGEQDMVRGQRVGVLTLKLGELDDNDVPDGLYEVAVYLFDAENDDGVFWDSIEVEVRDGDVPPP